MKRTRKIFLITLAVIVLGVGGTAAYFYFKTSPMRAIWNYVPRDAVYIIETDNLTKGWNTLAESKMWQHLISDPLFEDIEESATTLDSLIRGDETMDMLFTDRPLLVSCHLLPNNDFDFLFLVDLKQAGKFAFIKDYIGGIVGNFGYNLEREKFEDTDILIISDKTSDEVFYLSVIDNVFMASYNKSLVQNAITTAKTPDLWKNDQAFQAVVSSTSGNNLFRFYVSYNFMAPYISYYLSDEQDLLDELKRIFNYSAFNINLESERLSFSGSTILKDSADSYIHMLSGIERGPLQAYRIIPSDAAMYVSVSFADYMELFNNLKAKFTFNDSAGAESYEKSLKKMEKLFGIDLEKDFFSWIGTEIAMVKLPPTPNARENDMIAILHTKDIELAMTGLDNILKKVKNRTPVKIKDSEYKNFKIHYLGINGFFRMFFGKMFARIEKPYFIYMDDFVVFSNSPSCLMDMIDAYEKGRFLANDEEFMDFMGQFEDEANVSVFMQGPRIYSHLYYYAKKEQKANIKQSSEILASFKNIGFQLISEKNGKFSNKLIVEHNADALFDSELEEIENSAEELYVSEFDSLLAIELPDNAEDGKTCKIYFEDDSTQLRAEGRIRDGKREGMWRFYYESGQIQGSLMFEDGEPTGKGLLYYDEEDGGTKAQADFEDGQIEGTYLEYYSNGESKTSIEYSEGKPDGEAKFYYDSGNIKIEGEYKEGLKQGKWRHYTETGDLMDKEKWKKDQQKTRKKDQ
ncbi:hypothetical protein SDC9_51028 [bioreactor metagenome]|uniref:DUF3352 domain-containing protein n=1 Tax=bioreactor metagenome TaxID=1076179 RepID=A0A644WMA6_9ZZZZ